MKPEENEAKPLDGEVDEHDTATVPHSLCALRPSLCELEAIEDAPAPLPLIHAVGYQLDRDSLDHTGLT